MPDPEVERAAEFLAAHALLLLGLGILAAVLALAAIVCAVRVAAQFRPAIQGTFTTLVQRASTVDVLRRVIGRTQGFVPSAYLALHLTLGLVAAVAVAVFAALVEETLAGGEMAAFDLAFARALHAARHPQWARVFSTVSWLGSREVLTVAAVSVALVLISRQQIVLAVGWIAAQAGGGLLNRALKETFERTRPEFADPLLAASSWSFPSGHAMGTFILCGVGCYLLLRENRSWLAAATAVTLSASWCVVMAFSRLYLGVHFASDVMAGMLAGAAWVAVCVSALEVLRRRAAGPLQA